MSRWFTQDLAGQIGATHYTKFFNDRGGGLQVGAVAGAGGGEGEDAGGRHVFQLRWNFLYMGKDNACLKRGAI